MGTLVFDPRRNIRGIQFKERVGSGRITLTGGTGTAERTFIVNWGDWSDFVALMAGAVEPDTGYSIGAYHAGGYSFEPKTANIIGLGKCFGLLVPAYTYAQITITYELTLDEDEQIEETVDLDYSGEYITMPDESFTIAATGRVLPEKIGMLITITERTVSLPKNFTITDDIIRAHQGCVNDDEFYGAPAEYVLFLGATTHGKLAPNSRLPDPIFGMTTTAFDGTGPKDMVLKFKERSRSWNQVYDPESSGWSDLDPKPYELVDFSNLIP